MKYVSLVISFILLFSFVGCDADNSNFDALNTTDITINTTDITINTTDEMIQSDLLKVYGIEFGLANLQISEEQSRVIKEIWKNCEWKGDVTETIYEYVFIDGDREVRYSYDAGIFNDITNMRSIVLTSELRAEVNNIVDHLIVLPIID